MDPIHRELLQQAVDAAKAGETDNAIDLIKTLLDEDEENAQAWMLLARLSDDLDEKRVALSNVLMLQPDNKRAQAMLKRLEDEIKRQNVVEVIPGVSRRLFLMVSISIIGLVVIGLLLITTISGNNARRERDISNTEQAQQLQLTQIVLDTTYEVETAVQAQIDLTATEVFLNPPTSTPEPTSNAPTLPPTSTPTLAPTLTPTPQPPPPGLPGSLIGWSGLGNIDEDFPLVRFPLEGGESTPLLDANGRWVQYLPSANQYLYTVYNSNAFSDELRLVDVNGNPVEGMRQYGFSFADEPQMADVSVDETFIVFVAEAPLGEGNALYRVDLAATGQDALQQLTFDDAVYSYPAISPDGNQLLVVRDSLSNDNPGVDLVLIDLTTEIPSSLTTNRDLIDETTPTWSPDGRLIFYAGLDTSEADSTYNLYMMTPTNPDSGVVRVESNGDVRSPVFSPTGLFVAFADDRNGNYDVFLLDLTTSEQYQLTRDNDQDFPSDWR